MTGFIQELGWTLILVGGPMLAAALWALWTEARDTRRREAVWARREREAVMRDTLRAGRWES